MKPDSNTSTDARLAELKAWLHSLDPALELDVDTVRPASSDASFRRYYRLQSGASTVVAMDAPPQHEDCRPFIHVATMLAQGGLHVPAILAQNLDAGFLLLSDLGDQTFYQAIQSGVNDGQLQAMYRAALRELVRMQKISASSLPAYDAPRLLQELEVFPEWFARTHCQVELSGTENETLRSVFEALVSDNIKQPVVLVHRDFHSPNLMVGTTDGVPGIIDFQDALAGPISYDIASLVMDARTTWEEPQQLDWAIRYWEAAKAAGLPIAPDFADFHQQYEWMSLQRNLRILGVFARLSHRDGKHGYLDHIPRVSAYARQVAGRYSTLRPLLRILDKLENRQVTAGYTF
jgi:aminoglycoside/choline kinase family phosphotransferase